jgi:PAS domain S-box-containing protein
MKLKGFESLSRRLPLLSTALFAAIITGVLWTAYVEVRRATIEASQAHLESAAHQVSSLLESSLRTRRNDLRAVATDSLVMSSLRESGATVAQRSLAAALDDFRARTARFGAVSIWTSQGERLVTSGSVVLAQATGQDAVSNAKRGSARVSRFILVGDTVGYAVVSAVTTASLDTLGFVVGTLRLSDSSSSDAVARLLGRGARLLVGNADGSLWTNLKTVIPGPPADILKKGRGVHVPPGDEPYAGVASRVAGTPWLVWVDRPESAVMAAMRGYLAKIAAVGILFIALGAFGAWLIIRRVTKPLGDLRHATEVLALGLSPDPVVFARQDEIGGLAKTFNAMAQRVHLSTQEVNERAAALERRNKQLHESELRYRQLVDQSPDAVLVHRNGVIVFANAGTARMVGAGDADQLIGTSILDLVAEEHREEARARIAAIESAERPSPLSELRLRKLDGSSFIAEVSGTPIVFDGAPAIQTLARDVTERKSLEDQLRQSQKMEAVGRLAGGIAHDFNNLLTVINTYTELSLARMSQDDPTRSDLQEVLRAGVSAAKLTRQMLAFSRKQILAPRVLDLNETITALSGMLSRVLGAEVNVVTELGGDLGPIWADAGQIEQVLMNLAVNARDAMPNGGTLTIATAQLDLGEGYRAFHHAIPPGSYITLAVSDTGVGMTADVKEHLFEPFFTTKQPGQGTGLGLSTVYGIVKQSGGYIWVYSEPGHGSTFKIFIPRYNGDDVEIPAATGEFVVPPSGKGTILLVEDDSMVRAAVRRILERLPHAVLEAQSGAEAMEVFRQRQGRIDLVVTDMVMPSMTGADLIRELRDWQPTLPAIIMSGYSEETTTRDWRLPSNATFLEKPLSPARLLRAVTEALGIGNG